ncbi:hypothetical protein HGRIS_003944 [Hohenbuehelia grisea]|uniref:Uncharacterized protein n=1 Tax=Hohenbuehelia grisea TaxID=104357 RepID=A0ABR3JH08_9AGAR
MLDDDEDSLFGSPPPEVAPAITRGRSPSPLLALPGSSTAASSILLPSTSNPIASTSSSWPSAPSATPSINISEFRPEPQLRPPRQRPQRPKPKPKAQQTRSTTPRPGPQIELPGPDDDLPPNFLRNHSALLGLAGLVGHVRPANLTVPRGESHRRGSTPSNPIVLDDNDNEPSTTRKSVRNAPRTFSSTSRPLSNIDPSILPAPSNAEIVAALMKQRDVFPVLESILKLIARAGSQVAAGQNQNQRSPWSSVSERTSRASSVSSTSSAPPTKRRKLNNVPAGATDWDVPYPFSPGEGPEAYSGAWEQTRGRQLVEQLVGLVKNAAKQAAVTRYNKQRSSQRPRPTQANQGWTEDPDVVHKYYRPRTAAAAYGATPGEADISTRRSLPRARESSSSSNAKENATDSASTPVPTPQVALGASSPFTGSIATSAIPSPTSSFGELPNPDQATLNAWLALLQAIPPQEQPSPADTLEGDNTQPGDFGMFDMTNIGDFDIPGFDLSNFDFSGNTEVFSAPIPAGPAGTGQEVEDSSGMWSMSFPYSIVPDLDISPLPGVASTSSTDPTTFSPAPASFTHNPPVSGDTNIDPELLALSANVHTLPVPATSTTSQATIAVPPNPEIDVLAELTGSAITVAPENAATPFALDGLDLDSLVSTNGPPSLASPGPSTMSRAESPQVVTPVASGFGALDAPSAGVDGHADHVGFDLLGLGVDANTPTLPSKPDKGKGKAREDQTSSVDLEALFTGSMGMIGEHLASGGSAAGVQQDLTSMVGAQLSSLGMLSLLLRGGSFSDPTPLHPSTSSSTSTAGGLLAGVPSSFLLPGFPTALPTPPTMPSAPPPPLQPSTTVVNQQHASHVRPSLFQAKPTPSELPRHRRTQAQPKDPALQRAHRAEVLKQARERRLALVAELERAKVELWECTVEQGVLAQLGREVDKMGFASGVVGGGSSSSTSVVQR